MTASQQNRGSRSAQIQRYVDGIQKFAYLPPKDAAALPTIETCERAIGEPAAAWKGRCHEIAMKLVQDGLFPPGTRTEYGGYFGPIVPNSYFAARRHVGICRHGWIRLPDGRVVDPTRWVFEDVTPYLFVGHDHDKEYDLVMGRLAARRGPAPEFDPDDDPRELPLDPSAENLRCYLATVFGRDPATSHVLSRGQIFWLANQPPAVHGDLAETLYAAIRDSGWKGAIPLDFWVSAMERGDYSTCYAGDGLDEER